MTAAGVPIAKTRNGEIPSELSVIAPAQFGHEKVATTTILATCFRHTALSN
jgi:hypothetical protein